MIVYEVDKNHTEAITLSIFKKLLLDLFYEGAGALSQASPTDATKVSFHEFT